MPNWTRSNIEIKDCATQMNLFMRCVQDDSINLEIIIPLLSENKKKIINESLDTINKNCLNNIVLIEQKENNVNFEYEGIGEPPVEFFKIISRIFEIMKITLYFEQIENDKCGLCQIEKGTIKQVEKPYSERYGVNFFIDDNIVIKEKDSIVISLKSQEKKDPKDLFSEETKDIFWRCELPEICLEKILEYEEFFAQSHITHDDNYKRININEYESSNIFDFKDKLYKTIVDEKENLNHLFRQLHIEHVLPFKKKGKTIHKI